MRLWAAAAALAALGAASAGAFEAWHDAVDYTKLKNALGSALPTGAGVPVSQVEATTSTSSTIYFPSPTHPEFDGSSDPGQMAVSFIDGTGQSGNGASGHANTVGARMYGDMSSVAPGANNVTVYEANDWLQNILKYDDSPASAPHPGPPVAQPYRVQNHSWVGTFNPNNIFWAEDARNVDALRRVDYLIDTANGGQGMLMAVGLNNGQNPVPYLLAHSYNAISVGRTDGVHSSGLTLNPDGTPPDDSYGPGRSKPEIVSPPASATAGNTTSVATAMVSSAATLLYSAAGGTQAMNSEVIKAMLLAGATKSEFPGWNRTATRPLDDTFGAGELNVFNSYLTNLGGRGAGNLSAPAGSVGSYGWDYEDFKNNPSVGDVFYNFVIPQGSKAQELSIALTWNVKITDTDPAADSFAPVQSLQNLDLRLHDSTDAFLESLVDQSTSTVDNVEHIYLTNLGPGTYTMRVSGAAGWDYGLAWRMATRFDQVNADFDDSGAIDGADFLAWQRNYGTLLGALHADGDADGDGDVDEYDLAAFEANVMPPSVQAALRIAASVPEPGSLTAAALAAILLSSTLRISRRRRVA